MAMSRGTLGILARAALLLAASAVLNLVVNPFDIYGSRWFDPVVLSTRRTKLVLYRDRRPPPDLLLLGSSRSMTVDPAYIEERTGRRAFNAAVHGAATRDYLAFARCVAAEPVFPRVVVVALGAEQFRGYFPPVEHHDPLAACQPGDGPVTTLLDWRESLGAMTLAQTWASLRVLGMELTGRPDPQYRFRADGMLVAFRTPPAAEGLATSLAAFWGPKAFQFEELNAANLEEVRQLLELCRRKGARVVVYLPPYHPYAIELYLAQSRFASLRMKLMDQLTRWRSDYPVTAYDLSETSRFGGTPEMFSDASHPTDAGARLLVDAMSPALRGSP
jgi:hypothetical protein